MFILILYYDDYSFYMDKGEKKIAVATQFEDVDARRCFPCWDEPARKVTEQRYRPFYFHFWTTGCSANLCMIGRPYIFIITCAHMLNTDFVVGYLQNNSTKHTSWDDCIVEHASFRGDCFRWYQDGFLWGIGCYVNLPSGYRGWHVRLCGSHHRWWYWMNYRIFRTIQKCSTACFLVTILYICVVQGLRFALIARLAKAKRGSWL